MYSAMPGRPKVAKVFQPFADGNAAASEYLKGRTVRVAFRSAGAQGFAPHGVCPLCHVESRQPCIGEFGGEFHALRTQRRHGNRNVVAHRMVDQLQRFAKAGTFVCGNGIWKCLPSYTTSRVARPCGRSR
jgi:hypothetical protein